MTVKQKQWQLYYLGYYGGRMDGIWGTRSRKEPVIRTVTGVVISDAFPEKDLPASDSRRFEPKRRLAAVSDPVGIT